MRRNTIATFILVISAAVLLAVGCSTGPPAQPQPVPPKPVVKDIAIKDKPAPDFTLTTVDGQTLTLSSFRGKPVVLAFWSLSCPACEKQLPYLQAVHEKYTPGRIVILGVHVRGNTGIVKAVVEKYKLTFPMLIDLSGEVVNIYGKGYPTTFFIRSDGVIKDYWDTTFESVAEIELQLAGILTK